MKLITSMIITASAFAGVLSAGSAQVTSNTAGKCTLSVDGKSYSAVSVAHTGGATLNKQYTSEFTPFGSFLSKTDPSSTQKYEQEAYLYDQLTKPGTTDNDRCNIQKAVWSIDDSSYKADDDAKSYVSQAKKCYKDVDLSHLGLVTLTDKDGKCDKYIVDPSPSSATPEPSTVLLLGGGLVLVGGSMARRKKAMAKN